MNIPNVLATRYASQQMRSIFEPRNRVSLERRFWLTVMSVQLELGLDIEPEAVAAYEEVVDNINLESIKKREQQTRHDVKARIDEFNTLAGYQEIHKGLTSRDLTDNVEQLMVWQAMELVESRTVALLAALAELATEYNSVAVVGRTHNVAAQPTTMGKRFAQFGEELLLGYKSLVDLRNRFALRGIKGAVGSQQDQLDLLGSVEAVTELERRVSQRFGLTRVLGAVGQIYPRSLDLAVVSTLSQLGAAPSNLALNIRLMAGHEQASEGFAEGQVGSSAMPHKMNSRSCERINGLYSLLKGYLGIASDLAGNQWYEGDVSCSVVRRVVLPDAFFALDGLYETTFAVLRGFVLYPVVLESELNKYIPFLSSSKLLTHALQNGLRREEAHKIIKNHAIKAVTKMREGFNGGEVFIESLAADNRFPGNESELQRVVLDEQLLGTIDLQVKRFCEQVAIVTNDHPGSSYRGDPIL